MRVQVLEAEHHRGSRLTGVIDCDVHNALRSRDVLKAYLPEKWHVYLDQGAPSGSGLAGLSLTPARPSGFRMDTWPETGPPGSDLGLLRSQLLDRYGVVAAILHPILDVVGFLQYGEFGRALAAATNDWMVAEWLERDERLYGAITVPVEDAASAVAEIERVVSERRLVKVLLTAETREPLGHPKYWPIFEAAVAHALPVSVHIAGFAGTLNGAAAPTYHVEGRLGHAMPFPAQLISLVYSGVFDRWPELQIVFEEAHLAWVAPLLWRLDHAWRSMAESVPHLQRPPSEIVREHFWFCTQPLDEPRRERELVEMLEHLDMDDRLLFASDYPHHDFDDPNRILPAAVVGAQRREKILTINAARVFRF